MFGGGFGGPRPGSTRAGSSFGPGEDIQASVRIPFLDACKGTTRSIEINPVTDCSSCSGSGLKAGAKRKTCQTCNGTGTQHLIIQNGFAMSTTCRACGGQGVTTDANDGCLGCGGVGKIRMKKKVEVKIPAGVDDGMRMTLGGMGDAPMEGKGRPGDLQVRIEVAASKSFRRQGANIYHDRTVPFSTAILGGRVTVPTLDEDVAVRVPQGTQPGEEMVLRGRGVQRLNRSDRGDLFVRFNVTIPRSLNPRQRELMEEFVDEAEGRPRPQPSVQQAAASSSPTASETSSNAYPATASNSTASDAPGKTAAKASPADSGESL